MKVAALIVSLALLASCGADGPPIKPSVTSSVTVGSGGVSTSTSITARRGPVTVGVGF